MAIVIPKHLFTRLSSSDWRVLVFLVHKAFFLGLAKRDDRHLTFVFKDDDPLTRSFIKLGLGAFDLDQKDQVFLTGKASALIPDGLPLTFRLHKNKTPSAKAMDIMAVFDEAEPTEEEKEALIRKAYEVGAFYEAFLNFVTQGDDIPFASLLKEAHPDWDTILSWKILLPALTLNDEMKILSPKIEDGYDEAIFQEADSPLRLYLHGQTNDQKAALEDLVGRYSQTKNPLTVLAALEHNRWINRSLLNEGLTPKRKGFYEDFGTLAADTIRVYKSEGFTAARQKDHLASDYMEPIVSLFVEK
jgi:hypothetical protein